MKSVVIYAYYKSESSNYNLSFFCKKELTYKDNIDYIIVINGFHYDKSIVFPKLNNLIVIRRENIGFDFGAYNSALEYIENNNKKYDYYFFMNSGVIGPIIKNEYNNFINKHWTNNFIEKINDKVKLVGTTIVCLPHSDPGGYGPKVEGFFFMTDQFGLELLKTQNTIFCDHKTFCDVIINSEYGLSNCILNNGYSIDCMLKRYENIDWTNPINYNLNDNIHPSRKNSFYGISIDPYELIFHKWYWKYAPTELVNFDIIEEYVKNNL